MEHWVTSAFMKTFDLSSNLGLFRSYGKCGFFLYGLWYA